MTGIPPCCLAAVLFLMPVATIAQERIVKRPVATEKNTRIPGHLDLYEVAIDGTVCIDWRQVETIAAAPYDYVGRTTALIMALRDNTWKPFEARR